MKTRLTLLIFAFLLLNVPTLRPAFAAISQKVQLEKTLTEQPIVASETPVEKKSEYLLPFPGILPDHPLYFLKQVRDGIMDRLIVDSLRKAEFHILQADKRLNMGGVLVEQGKGTLAEDVISKGEKYLERAVSGLTAFKSLGRPVPANLIEKLTRSMEKHVEVLTNLAAKTSGTVQSGLTGSLDFVKKLQGEVEKLK